MPNLIFAFVAGRESNRRWARVFRGGRNGSSCSDYYLIPKSVAVPVQSAANRLHYRFLPPNNWKLAKLARIDCLNKQTRQIVCTIYFQAVSRSLCEGGVIARNRENEWEKRNWGRINQTHTWLKFPRKFNPQIIRPHGWAHSASCWWMSIAFSRWWNLDLVPRSTRADSRSKFMFALTLACKFLAFWTNRYMKYTERGEMKVMSLETIGCKKVMRGGDFRWRRWSGFSEHFSICCECKLILKGTGACTAAGCRYSASVGKWSSRL